METTEPDENAPPQGMFSQISFGSSVGLFLLLLGIFLTGPRMFHRVGSGELGVLYRFFSGTDLSGTYGEGLHVTYPWDTMAVYSVRIQTFTTTLDVLSFNGLTVKVSLTCRYRPIPTELPDLHQQIGPEYVERAVKPILMAAVREVIGNYRPEELYTTHSATLQQEIDRVGTATMAENHIEFLPVLISGIALPEQVDQAIEEKLRQQQEAQAYEYRIAREEQEKDRRRIEAEGIARHYDIVAKNLTPAVLAWLDIQATQALATSNNAKVVVLGDKSAKDFNFPIQFPETAASRGGSSSSGSGASGGAAGESPTPETSAEDATDDATDDASDAPPSDAAPETPTRRSLGQRTK